MDWLAVCTTSWAAPRGVSLIRILPGTVLKPSLEHIASSFTGWGKAKIAFKKKKKLSWKEDPKTALAINPKSEWVGWNERGRRVWEARGVCGGGQVGGTQTSKGGETKHWRDGPENGDAEAWERWREGYRSVGRKDNKSGKEGRCMVQGARAGASTGEGRMLACGAGRGR